MIRRFIPAAVVVATFALAISFAQAQHKWNPPRMPPPPGVPATTQGPVVDPPKTEQPGQTKTGTPKFEDAFSGPIALNFVSDPWPFAIEVARSTPARIVVAQAATETVTLPAVTPAPAAAPAPVVAPPQVVIPAPQVTVTAPNVSVSPPAVNVTTPQVNVQAPESGGFIQIGKLFGQQMQPYVDAIIQALALAFAGWITTMIGLAYKRITGKELDEKASNVIAIAAKNQAGALLSAGAVKLQGLRINVSNDKIALAVDEVMTRVPDALKRFGMTPQDVQNRIVEAIPQTAAGAQIIADAHAAAAAKTVDAAAAPPPVPAQPN